MQTLFTFMLALLLVLLALKLAGALLRCVLRIFLWSVKLAFVLVCVLSFVYFAVQFCPGL